MSWGDQQWAMFFELLDKGWPGELDEGGAEAYRILLDGTDPQVITAGVRRLLHQGARFRPSAAEILAAARRDPSTPTFAEALLLIQRAVRARPPRGSRYSDDPEPEDGGPRPRGWRSAERKRRDAEHQAVEQALEQIHPLAAAFARRQGVDRLRHLQLGDPDHGGARRHALEQAWTAHVEAFADRDAAAAALAIGGARRGELARLDPLAVLGLGQAPAQLTTAGGGGS
ncbi:MAG TPA: hypothetical protein VFZ00_01525 [Solirubrobacter sp.]|nr:hypothetical protein [Solirubrobacter sp.]